MVVAQGDSLDESSNLDGAGAQQLADADDAPPRPPEAPDADTSPDAGSPARDSRRREPAALDLTEPGSEGYDFRNAYGSLHDRNQFYRQEMNLRGNFFMREYLTEIDARAFELFTELGGSADEIAIDNFGLRTSSVYDNLEQMAEEAELAGRLDDAADIRAAMDEIEGMTNATLVDVAARTDEFSGVAIGSQRGPIDPDIDIEKLRSWLEEQALQAERKFMAAADDPEAAQLAGWERAYYDQLIKSLDAGVNPLAYSNEEIVFIQLNKVDPYYAQFGDEIAAAAAQGYELVIPRPRAEDELDLYIELQELLVETLSSPELFRSAEEAGLDAYTPAVRARIDAGLDFLGPDSLRPLPDVDIPQSWHAGDSVAGIGYVDEVRDRSFSRSTLAVSEGTLERQVARLAEGDTVASSRAGLPDSGSLEPSFASPRAPLDDTGAPIVDERTGGWVLEPPAGPDPSRVLADQASTPLRGGPGGSRTSDVQWESGIRVSGEPEAASRLDADTSDPFEVVPEPEDVGPGGGPRGGTRPGRRRRRLHRVARGTVRGECGWGREPDRHDLRTGRFCRSSRSWRRDWNGPVTPHDARHTGQARCRIGRRRLERGGHRCDAGRRHRVRCGRARPPPGALRRARAVRGTLARGHVARRRPKGARPTHRRCADADRGPPSRRRRCGRTPGEVPSRALRSPARFRRLDRRGR